MSYLVVIGYIFVSGGLVLYAANAYYLVATCLAVRKKLRHHNEQDYRSGLGFLTDETVWPRVTTQIPLYNEIAVAGRVIEAVAAMDYPAGRHDVQVLDDSTDETCAVVDAVAKRLRESGVWIEVIRRSNRSGYKAGALAEGTERCLGDFIAIFDADFVPPQDFLRRTIPHLVARPDTGFVQARWGHLNEDQTLLTRSQGVGIDGHFAVDQCARGGHAGLFMNFNGTAGVWRKEAIVDAGGWTADTLTEDLDLSYRAQLQGWKGIYLPDLVVPGELPADVGAFKKQQFRWAKGSIQTALKLVPALLRSKTPLSTKVQGWFHLTHYVIHPFILLFALLSAPLAWILPPGWEGLRWINLPVTILSLAPSFYYATGQCLLYERWPIRLLRLPLLVLAGIGLSLSNAVAVYEAITGKTSPFLRTPKQGESTRGYYHAEIDTPAFSEMTAGVACLLMFFAAATDGRALAAQFLLQASASFLFLAISSATGRWNLALPKLHYLGMHRME